MSTLLKLRLLWSLGALLSPILLMVLLLGCSLTATSATGPAGTSSAATITAAPMDDVTGAPVPTTPPYGSAAGIARDALAAYVTHGGDPDSWFAGLAPYLSAAGQQSYLGTDPDLVPAHQIVGEPALGASQSPYLATVTQGTDIGTYTVLLSRADDGTWQVENFTPPPGVGP